MSETTPPPKGKPTPEEREREQQRLEELATSFALALVSNPAFERQFGVTNGEVTQYRDAGVRLATVARALASGFQRG